MNDDKVKRLIRAEGKTRTLEMENGEIIERSGGSVSWRNNNPGNLKFEYAGSADETVHTQRTKANALAAAQKRYAGVVGLDQWGNAVFESYEAGRAARIQLLKRNHGERTVEDMLESYSRPDYSGGVNHRSQADFIYQQGDRQGVELRNKAIGTMTGAELAALADGIKGFEGWRAGETHTIHQARDGVPTQVAPALPKNERGPLPSHSIYAEAQIHFLGESKRYEYGRSDLPKPGRDPSRLERDLDGDGKLGVDCSAFVWRGLKNAGFGVQGETAAAFSTRTLFNGSSVTSYARQHFDVIPAFDARKPGGELQPGDILMFSGKGGQHVGIFKGYDANGFIHYIGSQSSTGPREVTIAPHGYWDGRETHIVGALRAKPEFQVRAPLHADPFDQVGPSAAHKGPSPRIPLAYPQPDNTVRALQQNLNQLGVTDAEGRPLTVDGNRGGPKSNTNEAIAGFQQKFGLSGQLSSTELLMATQVALKADPARSFDHAMGKVLPSHREHVPPHMVDGTLDYLRTDHDVTLKTLQQNLNRLGVKDAHGRSLVVDGDYGFKTRDPVAAFQCEQGLPVTGLADNSTLSAVNAHVVVAELRQHKAEREGQTQPHAQMPAYEACPFAQVEPARLDPLGRETATWHDSQNPGTCGPAALPATSAPAVRDVTATSEMATLPPRRAAAGAPDHTAPGQRPMASPEPAVESPAALRPFSDARHPQHALYEDVRDRLAVKGQHFPEDRMNQITAALHNANFKAGWEGRIDVKDDKVYAQNYQSFTHSGVIVPLQAPAPSVQSSVEEVQRQDPLKVERYGTQAREQGPQGPVMR